MSENETQQLRNKLASLSMLVAAAQADKAQLTQRVRQAEEMLSLVQTGVGSAEVAALIIRHMEQNHQTLAQHQLNLIQTTAVSLTKALEGSDEELRALVNTVCAGLSRAIETMTQIRIAENQQDVKRRNPQPN